MPIYEYRCRQCHSEFEKMTTIAKADEVECEKCGSPDTERLLSVFGVGSGKSEFSCPAGNCDLSECDPKACGCPSFN